MVVCARLVSEYDVGSTPTGGSMAKSQQLTRVEISNGPSKMNVLVDADSRLKPGTAITLKDSDTPQNRWTIVKVHETIDRADINYGWNNNI